MTTLRWIDSLAAEAENKLPRPVFEYFVQGTNAQHSLREATAAWDQVRFRPRVLRDVSRISTGTTVLGTDIRTPVLAAPSTLQHYAHPDGEIANATGLADAGSLMCVSSNTAITFDTLAKPGAPWWIQAYVMSDRARTADMLMAAREAGARAIALTADTPVPGRKVYSGPDVWDVVPANATHANWGKAENDIDPNEKAASLTPEVIGWLRETIGLPVIVKGILRGDDAKIAADAGADAIWVSNHGGRQLDGAVSTARALPEVADAVAGTDTEVYVDGGIRRGEHVLAALALGARAVFLGRPILWALTVDGADGVRRLIGDLTDELREAMMLAGYPTLGCITRDLIAD